MYCRECGHQLTTGTTTCPNCYSKPLASKKYCQNCGAETYETHEICVRCNTNLIYMPEEQKPAQPVATTPVYKQEPPKSTYNYNNNNHNTYTKTVIDEPNDLANFAAACCSNPIVGIILYLVWMNEKPRAAEAVCHWTIGGFVLQIIGSILYVIFVASIAG